MNPPLRDEGDIHAIIEGLKDGTIDAISTDHAPHTAEEEAVGYDDAPNGITGLETAFAVGMKYLVERGHISIAELVALMTVKPASCLGLPAPRIVPGAAADIVIFDEEEWEANRDRLLSKSSNTPYHLEKLRGRILYTICKGQVLWTI
jgi:dihydroorotase